MCSQTRAHTFIRFEMDNETMNQSEIIPVSETPIPELVSETTLSTESTTKISIFTTHSLNEAPLSPAYNHLLIVAIIIVGGTILLVCGYQFFKNRKSLWIPGRGV